MRSVNVLVLLMFCGTLEAQNLLENPRFDDDLSGWTLSGAVLPVWDSFDAAASPTSGSAFITNAEEDASTHVDVLSQCIVTGANRYEWSVQVYIPGGQEQSGSVVLNYTFYPHTLDCTGGIVATGGVLLTDLDQWTALAGNPVTITPEQIGTGGSWKFSIAIRKTEPGGTFTAYVDDASLFIRTIFEDSFE